MGYQTTGAEGTVVSLGSSNFYSTLLSRITPANATVKVTNDDIDITGLDVEQAVYIPGLSSWTADISGRAFATPRLGNVGTVVFSGGTPTGSGAGVLHVQGYELNIETENVHDITELAALPANGPLWRNFRPDAIRVSGRITAFADSATALSIPHTTAQSVFPTLTLLYGDSATDETIAGQAKLNSLSAAVRRGSLNTAEYSFMGSGAWTPAGTNSPLGSSALAIPLWSQGGSVVGPLVVATLTGSRTLTGQDSFWRRLTIRCQVGSPVEFDISLQGVGTLTAA